MDTATLPELDTLRVNGPRLWDSLMELARIGATPKGGVCRLTLTDLDKQGRDLVIGWARQAGMTVTVYGAKGDLHSGNYGNWGPNPALALARLLTSMKDDNGRILVEGFYDDVTPLTPTEQRAIDEIPNVEPTLIRTFGFARPENPSERLERRHNLPTLNINAMEAGGGESLRKSLDLPSVGGTLAALADELRVESDDQGEYLVVGIAALAG